MLKIIPLVHGVANVPFGGVFLNKGFEARTLRAS